MKSTRSKAAVTTGSRAWRAATTAAQRSIHSMTFPPKTVPSEFESFGSTTWVMVAAESATRFAAGAAAALLVRGGIRGGIAELRRRLDPPVARVHLAP